MLIWKIKFWTLRANFIFSVLKWHRFILILVYFFFFFPSRKVLLYYMFYIKVGNSLSLYPASVSQCCSSLYFILCSFFYPRVFPPDKIIWFIKCSRSFYFCLFRLSSSEVIKLSVRILECVKQQISTKNCWKIYCN